MTSLRPEEKSKGKSGSLTFTNFLTKCWGFNVNKTKICHLPLCFGRHLRDKYKLLEDKSQLEKNPGMAQITSWTHGKSEGRNQGFRVVKLLEPQSLPSGWSLANQCHGHPGDNTCMTIWHSRISLSVQAKHIMLHLNTVIIFPCGKADRISWADKFVLYSIIKNLRL